MSLPNENGSGNDGYSNGNGFNNNTLQNIQNGTVENSHGTSQYQQYPCNFQADGNLRNNAWHNNQNAIYQGHQNQTSFGYGPSKKVPQYIKPRKYHNAIPQRQNLLPFPQQNTRQPLIGIPRDVNESNTTQLNVTQRSQTANNSHIQCFNPQNRYQNTYHQNSGDYQIYHNQNPNAFACESSRNTTYENHTPVSLPYHSQNQICVYPPPQNEVHQNQTITNSVIDREVPTSSNNSATFEDDPINEFLDDNQHQSGSDIVQLVDDFDFDLTAEEFKKIFLESPNNLQQDLVETSEASEAGPASARRRRKRVYENDEEKKAADKAVHREVSKKSYKKRSHEKAKYRQNLVETVLTKEDENKNLEQILANLKGQCCTFFNSNKDSLSEEQQIAALNEFYKVI